MFDELYKLTSSEVRQLLWKLNRRVLLKAVLDYIDYAGGPADKYAIGRAVSHAFLDAGRDYGSGTSLWSTLDSLVSKRYDASGRRLAGEPGGPYWVERRPTPEQQLLSRVLDYLERAQMPVEARFLAHAVRGASTAALKALRNLPTDSRGRRLMRIGGAYSVERSESVQQSPKPILTAFDLAYEIALMQRLVEVFPEKFGSVVEAVRHVVGKHCGLLRKSRRVSIADFAVSSGVPTRTLYMVEGGELVTLTAEEIAAAVRAYAREA